MHTTDAQMPLSSRYPEGTRLKGRVSKLVEYGCSVELEEGIEGFLHATDMHWTERNMHPSKMVHVGDLVDVMVLSTNEEHHRISLGLKQCHENPWIDVISRHPDGTRFKGRVTQIKDYGCFVEIEEGFDGLVHVSEMHWTDRDMHPSKRVDVGDLVEAMVLDFNERRSHLSLGLKQCTVNPWVLFEERHAKNDLVSGTIHAITAIGIFVELEGGISGLAHSVEIPEETLAVGDKIDAVVLHIDAARERIGLGITQRVAPAE